MENIYLIILPITALAAVVQAGSRCFGWQGLIAFLMGWSPMLGTFILASKITGIDDINQVMTVPLSFVQLLPVIIIGCLPITGVFWSLALAISAALNPKTIQS